MQFLNQSKIDLKQLDSSNKKIILVIPPEFNQILILFRCDIKEKLKNDGLILEDLFKIYKITNPDGYVPTCLHIIKYVNKVGFCNAYGHELIYNFNDCWELKNYCGFIFSNQNIEIIQQIITQVITHFESNSVINHEKFFNVMSI